MNLLYKILALLIIDFILIWLWVYQIDPDPSISIGIFLLVPFVFVLNLITGGVLFYIKKKEYSKLFFLNSILTSIIMLYLFGKGIDRHQNNRLEQWEFQKADSTFSLVRWKKLNEFSITHKVRPGSSSGYLNGKCKRKNDEWILTVDSFEMKILDNKLIGFQNKNDTIIMNKIER